MAAEREMPASESQGAVRIAARAFERDRYLAALLAPAAVRDDLISLAAFAGEIARIPAYVSEPMIGEIRLQWWRDAIDAVAVGRASASGHPIADALAGTIRRHQLPRDILHRVIDAQVQRLEDAPFADEAALVDNLAAFDGGLFQLAWLVLGGIDVQPDVLRDSGVTYGFARCVAEAPVELAQGRVVLPRSQLASCGLSVPTMHEPRFADQWRMLLAVLAGNVRGRLDHVQQSYQMADHKVRLAALPIALVRPYLELSERIDVTALAAADIGPMKRVWRLWRTSRTGRA